MRAVVELTPEQLEKLGRYCEREGVSRAAAIRRAVDHLVVDEEAEASRVAAIRAAFGAWKANGETTDEYLGRVREEWGVLNEPPPGHQHPD
ncbi:MAG: ribbon-helix-helix protein, CopG family [Dehalococcoidia bacterium]